MPKITLYVLLYFFFQAEDGIRDGHVTGVQTCALPILEESILLASLGEAQGRESPRLRQDLLEEWNLPRGPVARMQTQSPRAPQPPQPQEIGRASCREREEKEVGEGAVKEERREVGGMT